MRFTALWLVLAMAASCTAAAPSSRSLPPARQADNHPQPFMLPPDLEVPGGVRYVACSRDRHYLFTVGYVSEYDPLTHQQVQYDLVRLWDLTTGEALTDIPLVDRLSYAALRSNGTDLALYVATLSGQVRKWTAPKWIPTSLCRLDASMRVVDMFPAADLILTGQKRLSPATGQAQGDLYHLTTGQPFVMPEADPPRQITRLTMAPDGRRVAGVEDGELRLLRIPEFATERAIAVPAPLADLASLRFSDDGKCLIASRKSRPGNTVVWDHATGQVVGEVDLAPYHVVRSFLSEDAKTLVGVPNDASGDPRLIVFDVATNTALAEFPLDEPAVAVVFAADGDALYAISGRGKTQRARLSRARAMHAAATAAQIPAGPTTPLTTGDSR